MNRRHAIYLSVILVLLLVNAAKWSLQALNENQASGVSVFMPDDFRLQVDVPDTGHPARDLFTGGRSTTTHDNKATAKRARVRPAIKPVSLPAPLLAASAPQASIGNLRLLGVVFHGSKRQAYLAQDKENVIASAGETVFGQYEVTDIAIDAVELKDTRSNITRRIPVSGK